MRAADIVITAAGQPNLVKGDWIKPGAVVIDVGIRSPILIGPAAALAHWGRSTHPVAKVPVHAADSKALFPKKRRRVIPLADFLSMFFFLRSLSIIKFLSLFFFLVLIIGFWLINRQVSKKVWTPFQDTLQKLKSFQLANQYVPEFSETNTLEFQELNNALNKLIKHSVATYKSQKEFTENASHELQTPLAIIKNKIDVLLQKEPLTERQFQLLEDINVTLTKVSHLNKNLLLLSKIENP